MKPTAASIRWWSSPRLLLILCPFLLTAPVWLAGKALYWGTPSTQFIPWWWQTWQTLRAGELPLWNPMVGMGAPLLANYQSALFYPPTWLYFLMAAIGGLPLMAWWQAISVALHLAWAGWGMAALIKRLGKSETAQVVAGLAFALSGYLVARAHFLSINATVAWLPWILLASYNLARQPRQRRNGLWLALALTMQWLAGHAQLAWYTLLLAMAWAAFWAMTLGRWRQLWQTALGFTAAAALAFALSAIQLLPTAEYLLNSQRATQVGFAQAAAYSFWPWRLIGLLAPNFFGNPAFGNYWGYANFWEDAIYIGLLPLALAISAIVIRKRSDERPLVWLLVASILISLLLALGQNTPLFAWLYQHVPTFALFQAPSRFSIWLVFAFVVLAAMGVDTWKSPTGRRLYWSRLAVAGMAAIVGVALGAIALGDKIPVPGTFSWAALVAGLIGLALALINLKLPANWQANESWTWLITLFLAADLLLAGWGLNPGASLDLYKEPQSGSATDRTYLPAADEYALKYEYLFRFDSFFSADPFKVRNVGLPNITLLDVRPTANNFDPLLSARYTVWVSALESSLHEGDLSLLAKANITTLEHFSVQGGAAYDEVAALPRFRWANCAVIVQDQEEALSLLNSLPENTVAIEAGEAGPICNEGAASIELIEEQASTLTLTVHASDPGWLVVADTWYPGWQVTVDNTVTSISPADGLFRAVFVDAGEHQVSFRYQPMSFILGLILSLFACLSTVWLWRRREID